MIELRIDWVTWPQYWLQHTVYQARAGKQEAKHAQHKDLLCGKYCQLNV